MSRVSLQVMKYTRLFFFVAEGCNVHQPTRVEEGRIQCLEKERSIGCSLHCALAAVQCIVIAPVCVFMWVCLWVCYHDNSKLRASMFTKLYL